MKKICIILSVFILIAICGYFSRTPSSTKSNNTLRVGMMSGWAPFMSINPQGQYEGFDVDVASALANKLGKKLEIIDLGSISALFIALEQEKIDMIFSGLDITQTRMQKYEMIPYCGQGFSQFYVLFWQQIPTDITSIEDLRSKKALVCVESGSASQQFLDQYQEIKQKPLASTIDMVMDVQYGRSTAAIFEPLIAHRFMKKYPEFKVLALPIPEKFRVYGTGIAMNKNKRTLIQQVQTAINALRQENTLKRLEQKWNIEQEQS